MAEASICHHPQKKRLETKILSVHTAISSVRHDMVMGELGGRIFCKTYSRIAAPMQSVTGQSNSFAVGGSGSNTKPVIAKFGDAQNILMPYTNLPLA